jgi:hypothetical protein
MHRSSPHAKIEELPPIDAAEAIRLLSISLVQFNGLTKDGWIKPTGRNRYIVADVVSGYLKFLAHDLTRGKTANEAAHHLDISQRRLFQLIDDGVIPRQDPSAGFDLDVVRLAVLRHQRKLIAGHGGGASKLDLAAERAALAREQRLKVARENAVAEAQYVSVDLVAGVVESEYSIVREQFLGLPGKEADALSFGDPAKRAFVEAHLHNSVFEILTNLSDPEKVSEKAAKSTTSPSKAEKPHADAGVQNE